MADKYVGFDNAEPAKDKAPAQGTAWSVPVEQKIINPPSGMLVLVILILLCLAVPGAGIWIPLSAPISAGIPC